MIIRELGAGDRTWIRNLIDVEWGLPVVSISGAHDPSTLPGFLAEEEGSPVGAVTYRLGDGECEVVTLNSLNEQQGVGAALLRAAKAVADGAGLRLWLITTDANLNAIRFYERRGMYVRTVHRDFVDQVRRSKPRADDEQLGTDFRHAIEFSY